MNVRVATGRLARMLALALALTALSVSAALAASGDLDASFDGDGWTRTNFGVTPSSGAFFGVAAQSDGKLVAVGSNQEDFLVARYDTDGSLDSGFGSGGIVTTDFSDGNSDEARAVVLDDGKILVAGLTRSGNFDFALARYEMDGDLDTSFSGDGKVATDINAGSSDEANSVAVQSDGKIVTAGSSGTGGSFDFALARYNDNGTLDTGFDPVENDGKVLTDFGVTDTAYGVALQGAKIVAAGQTSGVSSDFAVARYNQDGSLDSEANADPDADFDTDGVATVDFASGFDYARGVAVQPDQRIVLGGVSNNDFALARLNENGGPDSGLDTDGKVTTDFAGSSESVSAIALQPGDQKIILAGGVSDGAGDNDFALARYNPNGSLDSTTDLDSTTHFGTDGKVTTGLGSDSEGATSVAVTGTGVVAAGFSGANPALVRYEPDGDPDPGFGSGGSVTSPVTRRSGDTAEAIAVQPDGKIVAAGDTNAGAGGDPDFAVARYEADGDLDPSFGTGGLVTTNFSPDSPDNADAVAIQPDGKIVVAGQSGPDIALARYNPDGSLDSTANPDPDPDFDGDGLVTTAIGPASNAQGVVVQPDGKIVVAGASFGSSADFALARYHPGGSLDTDGDIDPTVHFGTDGKVTTDIGTDTGDNANAVVLQPDGKLVAAGQSHDGTDDDYALARYKPDGSLDTDADSDPGDFGADGKVTTDIGTDTGDTANAAILQPDGMIVATGQTIQPSENEIATVRYQANGALDPGFGTGGIAITDIGPEGSPPECTEDCQPDPGTDDNAHGLVIQSDAKLVAAGYSGDDVALVRYTSAGAHDPSFGPGTSPETEGEVVSHFGNVQAAYGLALADDGELLVAGEINDDFLVASYVSSDDPPVANDDAASVSEDAAATEIDVLANDTDPEADPIDITAVSDPANGTAQIVAGSPERVSYTPDADYCNDPGAAPADGFTYTVNGGDTATVSVTVSCVDDPEPDPGSGAGAPDTRIDKAKVKKTKGKAKFTFSGSGGASPLSFQCELDDGGFAACSSPQRYKKLDRGKHTFEVRAIGADGQPDPTPAAQVFKSKRRG